MGGSELYLGDCKTILTNIPDNTKEGMKCLYIPIDSMLTEKLEEKLFKGAKVKLSHGRIKTIKLRGAITQGLVVDLKEVGLENKPVYQLKQLICIKG